MVPSSLLRRVSFFTLVSTAVVIVPSCSASRPNAPMPRLVVEPPEPTDSPLTTGASGPPGAPVIRAWNRAAGALLAFEQVAQMSVHDTQLCVLNMDRSVFCLRTEGVLRGNVLAPDVLARNVSRVSIPGTVREVTAGSTHACAITTDHALYCWGTNDQGELGDGTSDARPEPARVMEVPPVIQVSAGEQFTCARTMNDRVWCWGRNSAGQLGDGTRVSRSRPAPIESLPPVADLAAGRGHACARSHEGIAYCWGDNAHRQLGCTSYSSPACTDPANNEPRPIRVPVVTQASQLALGDMHSCVRRFDDTISCWGDRENASGQLGYGIDRWPDTWSAMMVASGPRGSCVVTEGTGVRCWGDFAFDPFDRGENGRTSYPLPDVRGAQTVAMGDRILCVRFGDASARCWLR